MSLRGIILMQHFRSRESASYNLDVSLNTEAFKYYICTGFVDASNDPEEEIRLQTYEPTENGSCMAILHISSGHVALEALTDCVRLRSVGWGLSSMDHEGLRVSRSTADLRCVTSIRPDDIFYIEKMTFSVHVQRLGDLGASAEIQVTSSGHNASIAQDTGALEGAQSEELPDSNLASVAARGNHRSSTPTIPSSRPMAVMETPTAIRVRQLDLEPVAIMSSVDGNSMRDPPVLLVAANTRVIGQPLVEKDIVKAENEEATEAQISNVPDATDEQPSSTTDDDAPHSSPTPKRKAPALGYSPNQDNRGNTIQVEIPTRRQPSWNVTPSSKKRKLKSSGDSAEPTSSNRSTRSNPRENSSAASRVHSNVKVMFASSTSSDKSPQFMKFLTKQGVKTVKSVADCTILCVGKNVELKKTSNLILAVASGKEVVTDDWISRSATNGELLDTDDFLAKDPKREAEWGTTLSDAIERGRQGIKPLLGYTIFFTPSARKELGKGFSDIKEIAVFAGAECIKATVPRKGPEESPMTVVIAANNDDELPNLEERSWRAYSKEIITLSVLRGRLNLDSDEFLVSLKATTKAGKGRKRKL